MAFFPEVNKIKFEQLSKGEKLVAKTFKLSDQELFGIPRNQHNPERGASFNQLCQSVLESMNTLGFPAPKETSKPVIIITDMRFFEEYVILKQELSATVIQVKRVIPGAKAPTYFHPTNAFDPRIVPDHVIENYSTLNDLVVQVKKLQSILSANK